MDEMVQENENNQNNQESQRMIDETYMNLALQEAVNGIGWVNPNPMVGAIIVKNGKVIGRGYHKKFGELHAERNALANCSQSPDGATLYVTLEPCCHYGKTPPCTKAIIENGIRRVVIGSADPNPLVAGKGVSQLREKNIAVTEGILKEQCDKLNKVFFHYIQNKTPYVVMKYAMTMDGKISTVTGKSKWITGKEARENVHKDRHRYAAIMTGIGTVLADDPMLTCRAQGIPCIKNPIRIICDTRFQTPLESQIVKTANEIQTIIVVGRRENDQIYQQHKKNYENAGCVILEAPQKLGHIDLKELMILLGQKGIDSIFMEGGAMLNWSELESGIVNEIQAYLAPKLFGGADAKMPVGGVGVTEPDKAFKLGRPKITSLGEDILVECEVIETCLQEL